MHGPNVNSKTTSEPQRFRSAAQPAKLEQVSYLEAVQRDTEKLANKLLASDNATAILDGLLLAESVSNDNLFVGFEMKNAEGETFIGRGNLVDISSRLSRFYLQRTAKQNRKQIAKNLSGLKPRKGEQWRFITPTMPQLRGCSFAQTAKVYDDALVNLRNNKKFWKKIRAGVRSREFTNGNKIERQKTKREWTLDDGYHYHTHWIVLSTWLENRKGHYREFAELWKVALEKSAKANGVVLEFDTEDGLPIIDIRLIVDRRDVDNDAEISLEKAIQETAKYITKQDSLGELPVDQLIEISEFLRGKRMIEPLGEANQRKGSRTPKKAESAEVSNADNEISFSQHANAANDTTYVLETTTIEKNNSFKKKCLAVIQDGKIDEARRLIQLAF